MRKVVTILTLILLQTGLSKAQNNKIDKSVVKQLDLKKYMGTWYELARFDHWFERDLEGVTATYSISDDKKIKVVNKGFKGGLDGTVSEAIGKAKVPDSNEPGKLKVSFFWIFYVDYLVLDLDENYQWVLIGSSSDNYLWILSRKPHISDELYNTLLKKLSNRGYNVDNLIKVSH